MMYNFNDFDVGDGDLSTDGTSNLEMPEPHCANTATEVPQASTHPHRLRQACASDDSNYIQLFSPADNGPSAPASGGPLDTDFESLLATLLTDDFETPTTAPSTHPFPNSHPRAQSLSLAHLQTPQPHHLAPSPPRSAASTPLPHPTLPSPSHPLTAAATAGHPSLPPHSRAGVTPLYSREGRSWQAFHDIHSPGGPAAPPRQHTQPPPPRCPSGLLESMGSSTAPTQLPAGDALSPAASLPAPPASATALASPPGGAGNASPYGSGGLLPSLPPMPQLQPLQPLPRLPSCGGGAGGYGGHEDGAGWGMARHPPQHPARSRGRSAGSFRMPGPYHSAPPPRHAAHGPTPPYGWPHHAAPAPYRRERAAPAAPAAAWPCAGQEAPGGAGGRQSGGAGGGGEALRPAPGPRAGRFDAGASTEDSASTLQPPQPPQPLMAVSGTAAAAEGACGLKWGPSAARAELQRGGCTGESCPSAATAAAAAGPAVLDAAAGSAAAARDAAAADHGAYGNEAGASASDSPSHTQVTHMARRRSDVPHQHGLRSHSYPSLSPTASHLAAPGAPYPSPGSHYPPPPYARVPYHHPPPAGMWPADPYGPYHAPPYHYGLSAAPPSGVRRMVPRLAPRPYGHPQHGPYGHPQPYGPHSAAALPRRRRLWQYGECGPQAQAMAAAGQLPAGQPPAAWGVPEGAASSFGAAQQEGAKRRRLGGEDGAAACQPQLLPLPQAQAQHQRQHEAEGPAEAHGGGAAQGQGGRSAGGDGCFLDSFDLESLGGDLDLAMDLSCGPPYSDAQCYEAAPGGPHDAAAAQAAGAPQGAAALTATAADSAAPCAAAGGPRPQLSLQLDPGSLLCGLATFSATPAPPPQEEAAGAAQVACPAGPARSACAEAEAATESDAVEEVEEEDGGQRLMPPSPPAGPAPRRRRPSKRPDRESESAAAAAAAQRKAAARRPPALPGLPLGVPACVAVTVLSAPPGGHSEWAAVRRRQCGGGGGGGADSDFEDGGGGQPAVLGTFHVAPYLRHEDCIECGGALMSRSGFERAGGSMMAKWYRSIKVLPEGLPLGRWLELQGLPVLKGGPRRSGVRGPKGKGRAAGAAADPM